MKKLFWGLLIVMTMFFQLSPVMAKETTIDHFYSDADNKADLNADVEGSAALAGESVNVKSDVDGIAFEAANVADFNGTAEYGVFAGMEVNVNGTINNDTFIAGNIVKLQKKSDLKRDVVIAGNDVVINGNIDRNLTVYGNNVEINGTVNGNVKLVVSSVKVGDKAVIGSLSYPSDANVDISKKAKTGEITKTEAINNNTVSVTDIIVSSVMSLVSLVLIFAILTLVCPNVFNKIQDKYSKFDFDKGIEVVTKGLLVLILVPMVILLALGFAFGVPLAFILIALYVIAIYLSTVFAGYMLGYKIWQKFGKRDINILVIGLLGLLIIAILKMIPYISTRGDFMYRVYQVQNGDTLASVASKLGMSVSELASLNGLMISAILVPGQYIIVPNNSGNEYFDMYVIQKGDTIYELARKFNTDPTSLLRLNGLNNTDVIYPGDEILVPKNGVSFYVTGNDDTLDMVTKKLGTNASELARQNKIIYLTNDQLIVFRR